MIKITSLQEFENNSKENAEYKVEKICDSKIYTKKLDKGYLLDLYYLVL